MFGERAAARSYGEELEKLGVGNEKDKASDDNTAKYRQQNVGRLAPKSWLRNWDIQISGWMWMG